MDKLLRIYVRAFIFLFPLFFLPLVTDSYGVGKNILLVAGAVVGMIIWLVGMLVTKKDTVQVSRGWWWLFLLAIVAVLSYTKVPVGVQIKTWIQPFGLSTILALLGWLWLFLQVRSKEEGEKQFWWLSAGGIALVVLSLVTFLIPSGKFPFIIPKDQQWLVITQGWTLTGSVVAEMSLLVLLLGWWLRNLVVHYKAGKDYMVDAFLTAIFALGLFLDGYKVVKYGVVWLDVVSSWAIAVESFKQSPLWGVGVSNFIRGFEAFRPSTYNMTSLWSGGELSGSGMGFLHFWTELGVVALGLILWLLSVVVKNIRKGVWWWLLLVGILLTMLLPLQLVTLVLMVWLLSVAFDYKETRLLLNIGEQGFNVLPGAVGVLLVLGFVGLTFKTGKLALADIYFRQSLVAASKNDGGGTYQDQIKAIGVEQNLGDYRKSYSQTNMALAKVLLANKSISDDDKQKVSVLLQQAVREGKAAVALDGLNAGYWSNLATIYRDLIGVVDGAPDWALQAYQQAIVLDPVNPSLRLDMGGLLYAAGRYDEADRSFEQAVLAKPDFANGWYNWAYSAKKMNKLADAVQRLGQAVQLVPVTSGDYESATKELNLWKDEYNAAVAKAQAAQVTPTPTKTPESLSAPQPLPTMGKEEKVKVSAKDFAPPAITPEVTPTAQPTGIGGP